jgi:hypothetical protein
MNCSCFVQLCLEGIKYDNSRYVLGSSSNNIGIGGYVFDNKRESNYHNGSNTITISDYGKMYANKLAKYAYDRGFLYTISSDLSNIQVGDIIFEGKRIDDTNDFRGIHHIFVIEDSLVLNDGSKIFKLVESEGGGYPIHEEDWNSRSVTSDRIWGARFPLPQLTSRSKDIVTEHSDTAIANISVGEEETLSTITISKDIAPLGEFTVVIKLKAYNENIITKVYTSDDKSRGLVNDNEFVRGDGVYVRHFHLDQKETINGDKKQLTIKVKNVGNEDVADTIELDYVMVFDGYVTV